VHRQTVNGKRLRTHTAQLARRWEKNLLWQIWCQRRTSWNSIRSFSVCIWLPKTYTSEVSVKVATDQNVASVISFSCSVQCVCIIVYCWGLMSAPSSSCLLVRGAKRQPLAWTHIKKKSKMCLAYCKKKAFPAMTVAWVLADGSFQIHILQFILISSVYFFVLR
jgi:hypothetical protein